MRLIRSFDIFDTCLMRRTATPLGVFYRTAQKAFARLGISSSHSFTEDFVATRVNAERLARSESSLEEVSLEEIWRILISLMGWNDPLLKTCELEAEAELLVPVLSVLDQVRRDRQQGCRIVFMSDMYLPGAFIEQQLKTHGFFGTGDGLYVSGDVGKTKRSGNLFRQMLHEEKVSPSEVLHTGDNEYSDDVVPRSLGIRSELFRETQLSRFELSMLKEVREAPESAEAIAGSMRDFRLDRNKGMDSSINEVVSQFIGPFSIGFAAWVLGEAKRRGIQRLYFLSRDCQLILKVAREISPQFGDIDCRYLYVSRQALFLPSANGISAEEMPWLNRSFEKHTLKRLLAKVELVYEDVEAHWSDLAGEDRENYYLKSADDWKRFWACLNTEPHKTRTMDLIASRRQAACQYFEEEGLFESTPWAIVDFGWFLTGQRALWKLLKFGGWKGEIKGLYLGLVSDRVGHAETGDSCALFYENPNEVPEKNRNVDVFTHRGIMEGLLGCADHPMVHHYEKAGSGKVIPAFKQLEDFSYREALGQKIHARTQDFAKKNTALVKEFADDGNCRHILDNLVSNFGGKPTKDMVNLICRLMVMVKRNDPDVLPPAIPLNMGTALLPLLPKIGPIKRLWAWRDCYWMEGAKALTPGCWVYLDLLTRRIALPRRIRSLWNKIKNK